MIREFLTEAQASGRVVDLQREGLDQDRMGWVLDVGEEWLLLHQVSDRIWLDGYLAMRIDDITGVRDLDEAHDGFIPRALALREQSAQPSAGVVVTNLPDLLRSAAAAFPLVSMAVERDEEPYAVIGEVTEVTDDHVTLRPITPAATWDDEPDELALDEITTVIFDAEYERALALVANL